MPHTGRGWEEEEEDRSRGGECALCVESAALKKKLEELTLRPRENDRGTNVVCPNTEIERPACRSARAHRREDGTVLDGVRGFGLATADDVDGDAKSFWYSQRQQQQQQQQQREPKTRGRGRGGGAGAGRLAHLLDPRRVCRRERTVFNPTDDATTTVAISATAKRCGEFRGSRRTDVVGSRRR